MCSFLPHSVAGDRCQECYSVEGLSQRYNCGGIDSVHRRLRTRNCHRPLATSRDCNWPGQALGPFLHGRNNLIIRCLMDNYENPVDAAGFSWNPLKRGKNRSAKACVGPSAIVQSCGLTWPASIGQDNFGATDCRRLKKFSWGTELLRPRRPCKLGSPAESQTRPGRTARSGGD